MNTHDPCHHQTLPWRQRFDALVRARMPTPFEWGVHDCCLWAADAVAAQTGQDPAAEARGTYKTAAGAARLLQAMGGLSNVAAHAGAPIAPMCAGVGDIGLLSIDGHECLGVCAGEVWLVAAAQGLAVWPLEAATAAWKVAPHG